jgi:hypothetical protein
VRKVTSSRQGIAVRSLLTLTLVFSLLFATASSVFAAEVGTIQPGGGTITFGGGDVTVKAQDSATTTAVDVTYEALISSTAPAAAPSGLVFGSQIFSLTAAVTFKQFVEVTVKYTAADKAAAGGRDDNVALYTYDAAGGVWIEIASALPNVIDQTFTLSQLTLGTYALVLDAPTAAPVDNTTSPDTGGFGVTTSVMLAMGLVGAFFVLGGGFIVARGRNN